MVEARYPSDQLHDASRRIAHDHALPTIDSPSGCALDAAGDRAVDELGERQIDYDWATVLDGPFEGALQVAPSREVVLAHQAHYDDIVHHPE